MEDLLESLKEMKYLSADKKPDDLRNIIPAWYGGCNWPGPEMVLNPYALVRLFTRKNFPTT
jgi:hypothetical protein